MVTWTKGIPMARWRTRSGASRRFRILAVIADCCREKLCLVADTSLLGARVARAGRLVRVYGKPARIVSNNGTEFTSRAILKWAIRATSPRIASIPASRSTAYFTTPESKSPRCPEASFNVDVALSCFASMRKPRGEAGRKLRISFTILVAGTGFEPVTFRL